MNAALTRGNILSLVLAVAACALPARAQTEVVGRGGSILDKVGFDQKLGAQVPLDLAFRDESGRPVRLGDLLDNKRPVILTLVYYNCPMLCNQVLNGLSRSLKPLSLELGSDFDIVTVSIDPKESSGLAAAKKKGYVRHYGRAGAEAGWHFLTGDPAAIAALAKSVGFRYTYNPVSGLYAHAAGITILTPGGRVARYLFGIDYPARDVQFALMDASAGKVGSPIARLLMLCYDYDAASGKYTLAIMRVTQVLGSLTVLALGTAVGLFLVRERRREAAAHPAASPLAQTNPTGE